MEDLVRYEHSGGISTIVMDDGKANVMTAAMLAAVHAALDRAEADSALVLLMGRPGIFSAGFDLSVFRQGTAEDIHTMLRAGAELALRLLSSSTPVVVACTGHAYPEGAFLLMSADFRIGADGPYRLGMNEVAIGLIVPRFAIEIARARLHPAYFDRTAVTGDMFGPKEAVAAGLLDRVVPEAELAESARAAAAQLAKIHLGAHRATKRRVRGGLLKIVRDAIDEDLTLESAQRTVAARSRQA